jgi:hypothetical protein
MNVQSPVSSEVGSSLAPIAGVGTQSGEIAVFVAMG